MKNNRQESISTSEDVIVALYVFMPLEIFQVIEDFEDLFRIAIQVHCVKYSPQSERTFAAQKGRFYRLPNRKRKRYLRFKTK